MGCGASGLPPAADDASRFCLSFYWVDTIRLIEAPPRATALVRKAVENSWRKTVASEACNQGAFDIELKGRPFAIGSSRDDSTSSQKMCLFICEYLLSEGWWLQCHGQMSRETYATTWFLERRPELSMSKTEPAVTCCLNLSGFDDLHLLRAPRHLYEALLLALRDTYPPGVQSHDDPGTGDFYVKVVGDPWTSESENGMHVRRLLLDVLRRFEALGYFYYGAVNLKQTTDSLLFIHRPMNKGWRAAGDMCMLSLNDSDKLRLVGCPPATVDAIRRCILKQRGDDSIQKEMNHYNSHELKLKGTPWCAEAQDVILGRLLIVKLLNSMRQSGWRLHAAVDMSRRLDDKHVLVFKAAEARRATHFCLCPADSDRLRVIGGSASVAAAVRRVLLQTYAPGVQRETADLYGAHEFKLRGAPWSGRRGAEELHVRRFFCLLLGDLARRGWRPLASADVSAKHIRTENSPDYALDVHSWFFVKQDK